MPSDHSPLHVAGGILGWDVLPPAHRPLEADALAEFHAARLLLLMLTCGEGQARRINGRTKLVKLDFFLRYPRFLEMAQRQLALAGRSFQVYEADGAETEAPMIRYRYGPWDPRYRDVVAFLESRGLVRAVGTRTEALSMTASGKQVAAEVAADPRFEPLVRRAEILAGTLAEWTGTQLKDFIYATFPREVSALELRRRIEP